MASDLHQDANSVGAADTRSAPLTRQQCSANATQSAAAQDFVAAKDWCSRALALITVDQSTSDAATAVLHQKCAEYAIKNVEYDNALEDLHEAIRGFSAAGEQRKLAKAVRLLCSALLKLGREDDAWLLWKTHFNLQSPVLDALAFRREFHLPPREGDDGNGRYDEALQFVYRRDWGNAIRNLTRTLNPQKTGKSKNKDPVLYLLRCLCRMKLGELEEAVADAERVVSLLPTATEAYRWLSEALIALKDFKQASKVCKVGLSVSPSDVSLLSINERLQVQHAKKKKKKKTTTAHPPPTDEADSVDLLYAEDEEEQKPENPAFQQLRELKKQIKADSSNAVVYCQRAAIRLELKQPERAQSDASEAIKLDSQSIDGYTLSCEALYAMRRYAKALRVCEQGLRCIPPSDTAPLVEWEKKIQDALINPPPEAPVQLSPSKPSRVPKAVAARRQQKAQRAVDEAQALRIKCYEKAVELADDRDFGNAVYWLNKGESYEAAGSECRLADILMLRARCRYELKQYEHVALDAQKAIELDPSNASSHRSMILSLRARGHMEKARSACAAALELHPQDDGLLALQRGLTQRSSKP